MIRGGSAILRYVLYAAVLVAVAAGSCAVGMVVGVVAEETGSYGQLFVVTMLLAVAAAIVAEILSCLVGSTVCFDEVWRSPRDNQQHGR